MRQAFRCGNDWHNEDEYWTIMARDAEEAAEEFAEQHDAGSSEYPKRQVVIVIGPDGKRSRFEVVAESVREYTAYERAS